MKIQILLSFFALFFVCCEKENDCPKALFLPLTTIFLDDCENPPSHIDSVRTVTVEGQTVCIGILSYYTLGQTEQEAKNFNPAEYRQGLLEGAAKIEDDSVRFLKLATWTAYWPSIHCSE